jgi:uncharacterized membrane protein YccC
VLHRAVRVTLASCVAFYTCRFVVGDPQLAVYSCFAAIALGALSNIAGTAAQRLRLYAGALVASWLLVVVGTWAAVNVWVAAAGMFFVGFAVSYIAVGGPRLAGMSSGLLLMYILPSFPPYSPQVLDSRLVGITLGAVLITAADHWLWPVPDPPPFERRLAAAAEALNGYLAAMRPLMDGSRVEAGVVSSAAENAAGAARACTPTSLPPEQRPSGPFPHDRALLACAVLLRILTGRTRAVEDTLRRQDAPPGPRHGAFLLDAVNDAVAAGAAALSGMGPPPDLESLRAANRRHADLRLSWLRDVVRDGKELVARLRLGSNLSELGETADVFVQSVRAVRNVKSPQGAGEQPPPLSSPLWFASASTRELWWLRARGHLTRHSVVFQNALRLAVGLAVARYLAGSFDLAHGFWVLLATLTLMRTTATATRSALWPAFLGTLAGALTAAGLLLAFGQEPDVFVVVLPIALVVGFTIGPLAGPLVGPAGAQFFLTLAIAALFVQVAPATWRLAEVRLLDVVLGGVVGSVVGLFVWPRGGSGELLLAAARTLRSSGQHIWATVRLLAGLPSDHAEVTLRQTRHEFRLAEDSLTQSLGEERSRSDGGRGEDAYDWHAFVVIGHRTLQGSHVLRRRYSHPGPLPWPEITGVLLDFADITARTAETVAEEIRTAHRTALPTAQSRRDEVASWLVDTVGGTDPTADTLRVLDTRVWLLDLDADLREIVTPARS